MKNVFIEKKDGTLEGFSIDKIKNAISKSSYRALKPFKDGDIEAVCDDVIENISVYNNVEHCDHIVIPVKEMHLYVELALEKIRPEVAKSYRDYRNYKQEFVGMMDDVYMKSQTIMYRGDKENSNSDSALVSTKRSLVFNQLNKSLYQKFFMTTEELQACRDGYIYIHDMSARRDSMNCCLFDMKTVLTGGFSMGNMYYNEPKTLDTAFDVIGDVILSTASQQYGGFTVPQIDRILEPYAEKSYLKYCQECVNLLDDFVDEETADNIDMFQSKLDDYAMRKLERDFEQGFQGLEYKLNTVASSRGDYPFTTLTTGLTTSRFGKMATKMMLKVRQEGQGKPGFKRPVLFPKIVFLYDENLHGKGCQCEDVFEAGIECSSKTMYPDWLSLTGGEGYLQTMYKKYGKAISPMGCRAFLSPWYEKGGFEPADENDQPIFEGRFNGGAISLHLPMILAKARIQVSEKLGLTPEEYAELLEKNGTTEEEKKEFFEVLEYYMDMIQNVHIRTREYLGHMKASTNPVAYCEGGFYGGHLQLQDRIEPLLKYVTFSFGITALNELQRLYNGKDLTDDNMFCIEVMEYINDRIGVYKKRDNMLTAIYGTPAENLCGLQIKQFRKKYGVIKGVSDREYVSNSFHCHVTADITPTQKQDIEGDFWDLFGGGRIQYCRYPISYNTEAVRTLVRRAMDKGFYEGVNLSLSYCDNCGHEELEMDICPKCGSKELTKIDRMNGYLSFSRVKGDTRLNDAKMTEIKERKSM